MFTAATLNIRCCVYALQSKDGARIVEHPSAQQRVQRRREFLTHSLLYSYGDALEPCVEQITSRETEKRTCVASEENEERKVIAMTLYTMMKV